MLAATISRRINHRSMSSSTELLPAADARKPLAIGVDVGGTTIKLGLVDNLGRTVGYQELPTETSRGPDDALRRIGDATREVIATANLRLSDVACLGVGAPGLMDRHRGVLLCAANLPGWNDFPIRQQTELSCQLPVTYVNDATAAAYGERWVGSGKDCHSLILLTLGTGIGGGIIIGNTTVDGQHGLGAECGHIIIDNAQNARMCGCGRTGHLEAYASATALVKRAEEALAAGRCSSLTAAAVADEALTPKLIGQQAELGDSLSRELVLETARCLGIGITNLMHVIDPDCVLLGGAMNFGGHATPLGREFLQRVRQEVARLAFEIAAEKTLIDFAMLGGDAGYLGAAGLARESQLEARQR